MLKTLRDWWGHRAERKRAKWAKDHEWIDPGELAAVEEHFKAPGGQPRGMSRSEDIPRAD